MVENQAYLFLVFSLTGIAIGILFDIFRILRKSFKTPDIITYVEDVLFWILTGILILYNIWYFNNGEIRIYMFFGIIIGVMIYVLTLSNIFVKVITLIINKLKQILEIILRPIRYIFHKIYTLIKSFFEKIAEKVTNKRRNLEKNGE